jgi:cytochrome c peroxidase
MRFIACIGAAVVLTVTLFLCIDAQEIIYEHYIGDGPAISSHLDQKAIQTGQVGFTDIVEHGALLFSAVFNKFDGQGRPGSTGTGMPRLTGRNPAMIRTSGPDASSCAGCHNQPRIGGAGDFVANVFVLAQTMDPVTDSVSNVFSNERNTLGMMGSGPIEMLAREMSEDLIAIRAAAIRKAAALNHVVTLPLNSKGVNFGVITAKPDGGVEAGGIKGVDSDLIVKPFHQKGAVVSLRDFTNTAMNQHFGMQSVERFAYLTPEDTDADKDGVMEELSVGDITAITIFQAQLGTPGRLFSGDPVRRKAAEVGEQLFASAHCTSCHVPALVLRSRFFSEPNPFNPPGNLQTSGHALSFRFTFDMTVDGELPRLERSSDGGAIVRAYTDLKRHDLCDADDSFFCNEQIQQAGISTRDFITRKLWDVGNSAPYGHRGDLTTLTEAIDHHHGEARSSRDTFFALPPLQRAEIIEFLKTLEVLPAGSPPVVSANK